MKVMNRNRRKTLLVLAAALALSGCTATAEKAGTDRAASTPNANTPRPAPQAEGAANAATANAATANAPSAAPTAAAANAAPPQGGSKAGDARGSVKTPPAPMPAPQIGSGGNDLFLFTQARAAVNADPELKAANLVFEVKDGVVTLSGTVASAAQKSKAEQLVRQAGSKAVKNQLRVAAGN